MVSRRLFSSMLGLGMTGAGALPLLARSNESTASAREIEVVAQRFKYTPNEIHVREGEAVVLLVKALDFVHGMRFPDYGLRYDLMPGKITRVLLSPKTIGTYDFVCDNFCGDGHEDMHGQIIVGL